jgi:tetratricopeptide (TPR) repeat protein
MPRKGQRGAILLLLTAALASTVACEKIKSKQAVKAGNEFFKAGKYETALAKYQEAQRFDPDEVKLKKNIGLAYMGLYQPGSKHAKDLEYASKAIENLKTYVTAYPDDKKSREFLVSMYLATDRYDDAIVFYEQMLKADPKDTKAMGSIASMYFKKGDFDKGMEWQQKVADAEGRNPDPYVMIGVQAWDRSGHGSPPEGARDQARLFRGPDLRQSPLAREGEDGDRPRQGGRGHGERQQVPRPGPRAPQETDGGGQARPDSGTREVEAVSGRVGRVVHV